MENKGVPKQFTANKPRGKISFGIPLQKWHETITGHMTGRRFIQRDMDGIVMANFKVLTHTCLE